MSNQPLKVALITGAAKRVGREMAIALAGKGYKIAIHYKNSITKAKELEADINSKNGSDTCKIFQADLTYLKECEKLPHVVFDSFGGLDLLVNNASIFENIPFDDVAFSDIERYHATHVLAPAVLCMESARYLAKSGAGKIVNIIDIYADYPKKGYMPYTISKAGLKGLTRQLAIELAPDITANAIAPGAILEPVTGEKLSEDAIGKIPLKRMGTPEDIAKALLFLAESDYITGQTIVVDGGRSLNI